MRRAEQRMRRGCSRPSGNGEWCRARAQTIWNLMSSRSQCELKLSLEVRRVSGKTRLSVRLTDCVTSRGGAVRVLGAGFTVFKAHEVIA